MAAILLVAAMERELSPVQGVDRLRCGIGPIEAALATARTLSEGRFSAVLHVGIAGAATLEPGTVVLGSESIYCDLLDPASNNPRVAHLGPDADLLRRARTALPDIPVLPIATTARVGGGVGYEVEAMEGFGVLRAASLAHVPALELRAISNLVGDPDRSRWEISAALTALTRTVEQLIPHLVGGSDPGP